MRQLKPQALERRRIDILGLLVDELTLDEAVARIEEWIKQRRETPTTPARRVVTLNPEYVMAARRDPELQRIVNSADMTTPDGIGLILAGRILRHPFRGRVTGVALSHALAQRSAQTGVRFFLLGAGPGIAEEAALRFTQLYPGISIVGVFDGKAGPEGDAESLARIRAAQPDLVLVAYGMVKQDRWALRNIEESGATVAIGVGGVLDYVSGRISLAPPLLRRLGLEWAYRLYKEPWRWRRQVALLGFVWAVACQSTINLKNFLYQKFRAAR
ncbi:MAG: WecB/TagA/CpsF family glycosyltransferase [Chloroflexota bacterium]|nr:WecB/TagA/CpsF family glycosyltransferase [Chloroflexota bacterium]